MDRDETIIEERFEYVVSEDKRLYLTFSACKIIYNGEGALLTTFHDLTEETKYQKHLEAAKEKAEMANQAKSKFLASASHDLRQPLHAMGLLLSVMDQHVAEGPGKEILWRVTNSLEAMNDLFSGILDISKLDANAIDLEIEPVDIQALFDALEDEFLPTAYEDGLELFFVGCSLRVAADKIQLTRMLRNLISNAMRYTRQGRILVGCRRNETHVSFQVWDTGIGISEKDQQLIFQEFTQVGNPERDRRKGLGLGLAICERIAGLMGSRMEVRSQQERGSVFSFSLPIATCADKPAHISRVRDQRSLAGVKVLFIEDEADVRIASELMLKAWGCVPLSVDSLEQAQEILDRDEYDPDVMIVDYRLRYNQTGLDAIRGIRSLLNRDVPAIVVSGDTGVEVHRSVEQMGLVLLNKPLLPGELKDHLIKLIINI